MPILPIAPIPIAGALADRPSERDCEGPDGGALSMASCEFIQISEF